MLNVRFWDLECKRQALGQGTPNVRAGVRDLLTVDERPTFHKGTPNIRSTVGFPWAIFVDRVALGFSGPNEIRFELCLCWALG